MILLLAASAALACSPETLSSALDHAFSAWSEQQPDRYAASSGAARDAVGCLDEVVSPQLAARLHLLLALDAYTEQDDVAARAALRASQAADPRLDPALVVDPLPMPLETLVGQARALGGGPSATGPVELWFDGRPTAERPVERPVVAQHLDGDVVAWSTLLRPGEALPAPVLASPPVRGSLDLRDQARLDGLGQPLLFGGVGVGAAAGALWLAAGVGWLQFQALERRVESGESLDADELARAENLHLWTNALGFSAQVATGVGGGLTIAGLALR